MKIKNQFTVELKHNTPLSIASKAIRTCWDSGDNSDTDWMELCPSCKSTNVDYTGRPSGESDTTCWTCDNCGYEFIDPIQKIVVGDKDKALINRVANKFKHASTLEHLTYNFQIKGISRALLQELARHRMANLSVKSTRYTLKELKAEKPFTNYTDMDNQEYLDDGLKRALKYIVITGEERVDRMSILALDNLRDLLNKGISNDKAKYALPESYKTELAWTINARSLQNFLFLRTDKSALWEIRDLANEIFWQLPEDHKYLFEGHVK